MYNMTMALGTKQPGKQSPDDYKERTMKRGHVTGTKREHKGAGDWYKQLEEANIRKIEAVWQTKQQARK